MSIAASIISTPYELIKFMLYDYFVQEKDPRLGDRYWLVNNGLVNSTIIVVTYLTFVTIIGPRLMANRKPFDLRWLITIYNFIMASWNAYFFVLSLIVLNFGALLFEFDAPDREDRSEWAMFTIKSGHMYLVSKYFDLFDTIFFVLRKKFTHLSFLHLYHHSSVAFLGSMAFTMYPTSTPIGLFTTLNSLIHVVMYTYYGIASLGSWTRPYLWWKKYITQMQIVQFGIYIVYFTFFLFFQTGYRNFFLIIGYTQAPFFGYLFLQFYRRTYGASATAKPKPSVVCSAQSVYSKTNENSSNKLQIDATRVKSD